MNMVGGDDSGNRAQKEQQSCSRCSCSATGAVDVSADT
jgi:hypothetical protein